MRYRCRINEQFVVTDTRDPTKGAGPREFLLELELEWSSLHADRHTNKPACNISNALA